VEKGDLLTLIGGVVAVFVIALALNPHYLEGFSSPAPVAPVTMPVTTTFTPVVPGSSTTPVIPVTPISTRTPVPVPTVSPPYQIYYHSSPFTYPRFKMPDNLAIFGAGDIPFRSREMVNFAFVSESRGGLTQKFTVPYPVWVINTTVVANATPQYGNFKMVLCYGNNGTVIDGIEILNRGSMSRVIQTSGSEMYLIVTTAYIDGYRINLETPRDYYDRYRPG
jgi:hypothetical protein